MKKRYNLFAAVLMAMPLALTSCSDVLNMAPGGNMNLEEIWQDNDKVSAYLNTCYKNFMLHNDLYFFWCRMPVTCSDEAWDGDDRDVNWAAPAKYYAGDATASAHPFWSVTGQGNDSHWDRFFTSIHDCNYFLDNIDNATVTNESDRNRWRAEAHLLRAYYYTELARDFGCGMPLMDRTYSYDDDFSQVKKASFKETVDFIIKDCDEALKCADMPWRITTGSEAGRLPKALAYALKSRMSLYAASPLYNDGNDYWQWAYEQNKDAYEGLKQQGYELYHHCYDRGTFCNEETSDLVLPMYYTDPATMEVNTERYQKAFEVAGYLNEYFYNSMEYSENPRDRETIFQSRSGGGNIGSEAIGAVNGYKCGTCPSQEMVDCYETINGQTILNLGKPYNDEKHENPNLNTANTMYLDQFPYANRDPRFYAGVYFNGSRRYCWWPFDEAEGSPENAGGKRGMRQRWVMTYEGEPQTGISASSRTRTRTGYYIRKFEHPNTGLNNGGGRAAFKEYRFAEVILNYAEAAAHVGKSAEAIQLVNLIRTRAGMPDLPSTLTGQELLNRIINERRVELAFEEARYFDVRRLHKPDEDLSATDKWVTAMHITRNADGSYTYKRGQVNGQARNCWQNKWLKTAIPLNEVNRVIAITGENWQNPGW